ncbi:MAG TPA: tyrosine-type recombinase/integrase [Rhizomicrobium sp.]
MIRTLEPMLGKPAAETRRCDIRDLLDRKADEGFPREAEQRRISLGTMFRWALGQDYIHSDPTAGLASYGRSAPRDRVLSDGEIGLLWPWLSSPELPGGYGEILKLQLLTGARCGEIGGLISTEIDQVNWLWTLPSTRSKNGRSRVTPLVGLARDILKATLVGIEGGPLYATRSGVPLKATHLGNALNGRVRPVPIAKFTTHDLRRTVVTKLADLGIPLETIAAVVGHEPGGPQVRTLIRHYVKTDFVQRKTAALTVWDRRLRELISPPALPITSSAEHSNPAVLAAE